MLLLRWRLSRIVLCACLAGMAGQAEAQEKQLGLADLVEQTEPAVVRLDVKLKNGRSIGSGFVIDSRGWVVTNHHVVEGAESAVATFNDNSEAEVVGFFAQDKLRDLVVLKVETSRKLASLPLAPVPPRKGESTVAIGAPSGLSFTITEGGIRDGKELETFGLEAAGTWLQTSTPISPGSSGGPLLNRQGEVVGANSGSLSKAQNINFAISAQDIGLLVKSAAKSKLQDLSEIESDEPERTVVVIRSSPRDPFPSRPRPEEALPWDKVPGQKLAAGTWHEMIPAMDPRLPAEEGDWHIDERAGTLSVGRNRYARIVLPFMAHGSYDLRMKFRKLEGDDCVAAVIPVGDRNVLVIMDGWPFFGVSTYLSNVDGVEGNRNKNAIKDKVLEIGKNHQCDISVEVEEEKNEATICVKLDQRELFTWQGSINSLSVLRGWTIPNPRNFAVGTFDAPTVFSSVSIRPKDDDAVKTQSESKRGTSVAKSPERSSPKADLTATDTAPSTSSPAQPENDPELAERQAAGKLLLAKNLLSRNKNAAERYLKEIVENFPGTEAAQEATDLLRKL